MLGLLAAAALAYGVDWLSIRLPKNRQIYADIPVDTVYTDTNKWNETEYSIGGRSIERCVYALFPHDGFRPCWYVARHTMNVTKTD